MVLVPHKRHGVQGQGQLFRLRQRCESWRHWSNRLYLRDASAAWGCSWACCRGVTHITDLTSDATNRIVGGAKTAAPACAGTEPHAVSEGPEPRLLRNASRYTTHAPDTRVALQLCIQLLPL